MMSMNVMARIGERIEAYYCVIPNFHCFLFYLDGPQSTKERFVKTRPRVNVCDRGPTLYMSAWQALGRLKLKSNGSL